MIKGISHITLICHDLEKSAYLLKEIFAAKEIYDSSAKNFSLAKEKFFLINDLWFALMQGESLPRSYNHIAFQVEAANLPIFEEKIKALGLTLLTGRTREEAEGKSLYFYDYDNHLFELHTGDLTARLNYYKS